MTTWPFASPRGPVPLSEALPIARQIAQALEAAHEQGIVHRDLKPANVKVTEDGTVKVLDFGLAKALAPDAASAADAMQSPTLTARATQMGVILGTAAYMAPEQAKGRPVDRRADMWAFGVVFYEMLTGRRAFEGGDVTEVLASVIKDAPALDALPPGTPASIRRLISRCLQKDRIDRLADASTARLEITEALSAPAAGSGSPPAGAAPQPNRRMNAALVGSALILAVVAGAAAWWLKPAPEAPAAPISRFSVALSPSLAWTRVTHHVMAVSPDGSHLAYIVNSQLHVRAIDQFDSTIIASVRDPFEVCFSPDGKWLGFYADGKLQKVALSGGSPVPIAPSAAPSGAHWTEDDWIVYALPTNIMRIRAGGGTAEEIVKRVKGERFANPQMLPGGRAVLYSAAQSAGSWDDAEIIVESLDTHERTVVIRGGSDARYLPQGYLVYGRNADLFAVPFDLATLTVTGAPVAVVNGVAAAAGALSGSYQFDVSDTGLLAFVPGSAVSDAQLASIGRDGRETPIAAMPGVTYPRVSPDGSKIAFTAIVAGNSDIYIRERARNAQSRLTFDAARDLAPIWTPDNKRIVYASSRDGSQNLYWQAADGTGSAERLTTGMNDQYPYAITPDGKAVLYIELTAANSYNIFQVPLSGDRTPTPLLDKEFDERRPALSPDGRWLAYQSNESGQFEIFVRPYPNVEGGRWQVSTGGGSSPLWDPNGKGIVYRQGQLIQHVAVSTSPAFAPGTPATLSATTLPVDGAGMSYAMAPDGTLIVVKPIAGAGGPIEYRLVLNWIEDLRARVKAGK